MSNNTKEGNKTIGYLILIAAGLYVAWYILKVIYYSLSYLALNLFLALDLSAFGKLSDEQWTGYALLGLGLGAAGGAIAAQQRFRLNKLISAGAIVLALALSSFVFVSDPDSAPFPGSSEETETTETEPAETAEVTPKHYQSTANNQDQEETPVAEQQPESSENQTVETDTSTYADATNEEETEPVTNSSETSEIVVNENTVLDEMELFYSALNSDDFSAENFFASDVKRFIKEKNLTPSEIDNLHNDYRAEFTNGSNRIQKSTIFKMDQIDGLSYYQFWVDFDCFRQSKQKNQTCKVLVEVGIDQQGKIASYQESRVKELRFY